MPRLRKLRRKQKFQYHVNRKRLNNKLTKQSDIKCEAVKKAWDVKKSLTENLTSMGLVADPNTHKGFRIPSGKELMKKNAFSKSEQEAMMEDEELNETNVGKPRNQHVVEELAKQAVDGYKAKKSNPHPLPPEMFRKLTKFIDKYGEDFEAMAMDHMNHYQETPAQLRSQVNRLKNIPQQWIPYLKSRGLFVGETTDLSQ